MDWITQQLAFGDQVIDHVIGQVRVNRGGAKAQNHGKLMRIARQAGFHNNVGVGAQAGINQMMVHRAGRHQGVRRQIAFTDFLVRQHQQGFAIADGLRRFFTDARDGSFQAFSFRVVQVNIGNLIAFAADGADLMHLGVRQHRAGHNQAVRMFRALLKDVLLAAETGFQRHHNRFTQWINRRVGDLRKLLAEVIRYMAHLARQHRHRRIIAHGADGFLAAFRNWAQQLIALFKSHQEHFLRRFQVIALQALIAQVFLKLRTALNAH